MQTISAGASRTAASRCFDDHNDLSSQSPLLVEGSAIIGDSNLDSVIERTESRFQNQPALMLEDYVKNNPLPNDLGDILLVFIGLRELCQYLRPVTIRIGIELI